MRTWTSGRSDSPQPRVRGRTEGQPGNRPVCHHNCVLCTLLLRTADTHEANHTCLYTDINVYLLLWLPCVSQLSKMCLLHVSPKEKMFTSQIQERPRTPHPFPSAVLGMNQKAPGLPL